MKLNFLLIIILLLFCANLNAQNGESYYVYKPNDTIQQIDIIYYLQKLFKLKVSQDSLKSKKVHFSVFPTDANNSSGRLLVTSFNATFTLGDAATTNTSTVYFIPYITFENQFGVQIYPTIWLKNNNWNFVGDYYALNYPEYTWGLGGNSPESNETLINSKRIRIHQNALKGIFRNFAVGIGYQFDEYYDINIPNDSISATSNYFPELFTGKSISSALTLPLIYDSRKNTLNPQGGFYTSFTYRNNMEILGSTSDWSSIFLDVRKYFPIKNTRSILALRSYYWSIVSGDTPYFDLPSNGSEPAIASSSRGIQSDRYRSNAMLYFEGEYRFNILRNGFLGGVVFSNITSASAYETQNFQYWHPAAGFGARVKFNKYSNINVDFDIGFSKDYWGLYLNIGEAF